MGKIKSEKDYRWTCLGDPAVRANIFDADIPDSVIDYLIIPYGPRWQAKDKETAEAACNAWLEERIKEIGGTV